MDLTRRGWCRKAHAEKHSQVWTKHTQGSIHTRTEANTAFMYTYISARGRQSQYQTMSTYWPSHTCKDSHTYHYAQAHAHAYAHENTQKLISSQTYTHAHSLTQMDIFTHKFIHIHKDTHTNAHWDARNVRMRVDASRRSKAPSRRRGQVALM